MSKKQEGGLGEALRTIIYAVILAFFVRTFAFEPFSIPSGSMIPTLLVGDYLFVSKYSYGYSRYSLPLSPPLFSGRIMASDPERGDVIVFKFPPDNETDYIKRLVGLPGDKIQVIDDVLHINGEAVKREFVRTIVEYGKFGNLDEYKETLPNGVEHLIWEAQDAPQHKKSKIYEVPEGHYFFMGDNRDNSSDSRSSVGYVPFENLIGEAQVIFFSKEPSASFWKVWEWPSGIRWGRLGDSID